MSFQSLNLWKLNSLASFASCDCLEPVLSKRLVCDSVKHRTSLFYSILTFKDFSELKFCTIITQQVLWLGFEAVWINGMSHRIKRHTYVLLEYLSACVTTSVTPWRDHLPVLDFIFVSQHKIVFKKSPHSFQICLCFGLWPLAQTFSLVVT